MACDLQTGVSVASILGVIVAIGGLCHQIYRSRFTMDVELILKLDEKFNRGDFRELRSAAAKELKTGCPSKNAEDIFDFFETLGYLVREKAITEELAWHSFYDWVHGYWSVGHQQIMRRRQEKKDPELWADFELLHKKLLKVQRRKSFSGEPELLCTAEIQEFLQDETIGING